MTTTEIDTFLARWADAERRGDAEQMDELLADDFVGIGPVGFVLDRTTWLSRFGMGLTYDDLRLDEVAIHRHGDTVIAVAHQHAHGHAGGTPTPADTRVAFTIITGDRDAPSGAAGAGPRIAGMQYSFIGPPLAEL
jgi:ketosteroid isomerase-like protein